MPSSNRTTWPSWEDETPAHDESSVNDLQGARRKLKAEKTGIGADQDLRQVDVGSQRVECLCQAGGPQCRIDQDQLEGDRSGDGSRYHNVANVVIPAIEKEGLEVLPYQITPRVITTNSRRRHKSESSRKEARNSPQPGAVLSAIPADGGWPLLVWAVYLPASRLRSAAGRYTAQTSSGHTPIAGINR